MVMWWWWWNIGDIPASYYMFAFCVVFVLVARLCEGGAESPHPPLEIIRQGKPPLFTPPKLFADQPTTAAAEAPSKTKIHLSAEIRDTIRQQEEKTQTDTREKGEENADDVDDRVKLLEARLSTLEKLLGAMDARVNTLEDWVQVESDLQEQDILMRAKAHDRANKKNK
jgi:hypothetical protein